MNQDTLKQVTLLIAAFCIIIVIFSIFRSRMLWKYTFNLLKKDLFIRKKLLGNLFLCFFLISLLFSFAYSSLDTTSNLASKQESQFLGDFSYVYVDSSSQPNIDKVISKQSDEARNSILVKGIYYNISLQKDNGEYLSNVILLGLNNVNLDDNEFVYYSNDGQSISDKILSNDNILTKKDENKVINLYNLDKFRGLIYANNSNSLRSTKLLIVNEKTASLLTLISSENIVFSKKPFDMTTTTLTKDESDEYKSMFVPTYVSLGSEDYKNNIISSISPFNLLILIGIVVCLIVFYPVFRNMRFLVNSFTDKYDFLRMTGGNSGNVSTFLIFYIFLPFLFISILSVLAAYFVNFLLYQFIDFSFLYNNIPNVNFDFNFLTIFSIFTNVFSLLFLFIFIVFYSSYSPQNRFKPSKISIVRLTIGVCAILFGIVTLFFLNDIPADSKGIIPFIILCGPITSILGSLIFFRLDNFKRRIAISVASLAIIVGSIILFIRGDFTNTPVGIFLLGLILLIILSSIINEFGYRDFPKMILNSLALYLFIFMIVIAPIGVSFDNQKFNIDMTFQTYSMVNKSLKLSDYIPSNEIVSKVTLGRAVSIGATQEGKESINGILDLVSVGKDAISSKNISEQDKINFFSSEDSVILSPEFSQIGLKEGDSLELMDIVSGQKISKKIFKIMEENTNTDLSNKVIFPDLYSAFPTAKSSLNSVYLIKFDENKKDEEKSALKKTLDALNIFDIEDLDKKVENTKTTSSQIFQSIRVLLIIFSIIIILFTVTKDIWKGFLLSVLSISVSLFTSLIYVSLINNKFYFDNSIVLNLIIIFISFLLIYGTNFAYRKIKVSK